MGLLIIYIVLFLKPQSTSNQKCAFICSHLHSAPLGSEMGKIWSGRTPSHMYTPKAGCLLFVLNQPKTFQTNETSINIFILTKGDTWETWAQLYFTEMFQMGWLQNYFWATVSCNSVALPSHLIIPVWKVISHLTFAMATKGICPSILNILSQQFLCVLAQERSYKVCSCLHCWLCICL